VDYLLGLSWSSSPSSPWVFPLARVEPMDGNDIAAVVRGIVAHRDVQGLIAFLHAHV